MIRVPPAIGILAAIAVALAVNRFAPELFSTIIVLLVIYLIVTHADKAGDLATAVTASLERLFHAPAAGRAGPPD